MTFPFTADGVRAEMRDHVRNLAGLAADRGRKAALQFVAGVLGLPYSRVKTLFYGEARRIEAHEADQIRAYVDAATKLLQARTAYEAQRREFVESAHPSVVRLAPPEVAGERVPPRRAAARLRR